ncbi:MAG: hypothetical protein A3F92_14460 [Candidatus Rokubacteria bacterium RIFCSPLOWO2_12_FULL_71_22]|nr:MAG: hypothetical protein A3F92_14460 [Candidatus Rokubacteria bacterium RIFCSPLOWO2_12_FULL_71_22]
MKIYLEENLSPRIAELLRARGVDAVSAHEVGNTQLDDRAQLLYATREGRAIVTADIVDFTALATAAVAANAEHAGMILVSARFRGDEVGAIARGIAAVVERSRATGLTGTVVYLSPGAD